MMISRDAFKYLRSVNRQNVYVCPFCASRGVSSRRSYASASASRRQQPPLESTPPPAAGPPGFLTGNGNVREYLKKWAQSLEKQNAAKGNEFVVVQNRRSTPESTTSSLFIRDVSALEDAKKDAIDADQQDVDSFADDFDLDVGEISQASILYLQPGDVYLVKTPQYPPQLGIHLGYIGRQCQLLLQNGKWLQCMTFEPRSAEIIHNFASPKEIAKIRELMPKAVISPDESVDRNGLTAVGEIPAELFAPFTAKFRHLNDQIEAFHRDHAGKYDQLYDTIAEESTYKYMELQTISTVHMGFDFYNATPGARMAFTNKLLSDRRFISRDTTAQQSASGVIVVPRRVSDAGRVVASWARDYQDAAARASSGKDVLPALRANPLTQFIAKARRLISKSRKIRIFDEHLQPSPTFPDALPEHTLVERKPSGEGFTEQEKQILTVIWDIYIRRPVSNTTQTRLLASVVALILRAVGAYPDRKLDGKVARCFMKELGCVEPWSVFHADFVDMPLPFLGLNYQFNLAEQREKKGKKDLGLLDAPKDFLPPDRLAHVRKDWEDVEAFAVDPVQTRVVDDAFSIVPSTDQPDCTWIHMHVAHPSAFIPPKHDFLARAELMKRGFYGQGKGTIPYLDFEFIDKISISAERPSPVLTISTLIHNDGSVKDVQVSAGTLRNVVRVNSTKFAKLFGSTLWTSSKRYHLEVNSSKIPKASTSQLPIVSRADAVGAPDEDALIEQHQSKFELLHRLVRARFEARKRENPHHLRTVREPSRLVTVDVNISGSPDMSFERIMKSEHCYGDPHVSISRPRVEQAAHTFADYAADFGVMYQIKSLATESLGLWTRQRQVPVVYNIVEPLPEFPLQALNAAQRGQPVGSPITGKSLQPLRHIYLNVNQYCGATSPLRKYDDLVNQYQVSAFLLSQASANTSAKSSKPSYPYSTADLKHVMKLVGKSEIFKRTEQIKVHWAMYTFYRAWKDNADFPKLHDFRTGSILTNYAEGIDGEKRRGFLEPWIINTHLMPTEQGYEKSAKASQYLPVKIVDVQPNNMRLYAIAVGPASDEPHFPQNFVDESFNGH